MDADDWNGQKQVFPVVALAATGSVLVAACSSGQDDTSADASQGDATATEQPDLADELDQVILAVTFDRGSCVYDGREELGPGKVLIEIVNQSSGTAGCTWRSSPTT